LHGVFVTGTGTEVGKTVVAAVIAHSLASADKTVAVFKPAVTGLDELPADGPESEDIDRFQAHRQAVEADHVLLRRAAGSAQSDDEIAPYRYGPAASPHLAASLAGEEIELQVLLDGARHAAASADLLVCEGVGGLLVPLAPSYLVRDFAAALSLPVIIAASPGLGTINHTLLTIDAARASGLDVALVVLTPWPREPGRIEESNRETIETIGGVEVETLAELDLEDEGGWSVDWRLIRQIDG
jgi:dethiobiotin synthetase